MSLWTLCLGTLCLGAVCLPVASAAADAGGVRGAEKLRGLVFERSAGTAGEGPSTRSLGGRLRFEALGRSFALALESNDELVVDLAESALEGIELYKGRLEGADGSWARLSRVGGQWAGLFFDGEALMAVEPELGIGHILSSDPVLYRLEDSGATGTCAAAGGDGTPAGLGALGAVGAEGAERTARATSPSAASHFIDVAVIGDARYSSNQDDPMGLAIALFNAVDGLYAEQVGVALNVVGVDLLSDDGGLSSSEAGRLLDQLADLAATSSLDNPGLVHLLTGRNLDGSTVGIAFIAALCNESAGVSLSEIRNGSFGSDTILIAHEIGHNFGAPHDSELGSPCSGTPTGFVMSPNLGDTSERFSSCSLDRMEPEIATASCLADLPPDEPVVTEPCLFDADFSLGPQAFVFVPDKQTPKFTLGRTKAFGLRTRVGGVNGKNKKNLLGTWELACHLDEPTSVRLTLDANLIHAARYDQGEKSKLRLRVNGEKSVLATIKGADDDGEVDLATGSKTYEVLAELPAGTSRIKLDCMNNRKTGRNEITRCDFERLSVEAR
ncbi:MAG: zinc-dependent metalloprotease family protein [Myxococcota bacterium]